LKKLKQKTLDRGVPPPTHDILHVAIPKPVQLRLDNGMPLYVLDFPEQEIVKVEVVFRAGRAEETKRLTSRATSRLLREGTASMSGEAIAEHIDFYGASLSVPTNLDTANFTLFSLHKYVGALLPLFAEILRVPTFPETELETFQRTNIQELAVELEKVEVVAYRTITELLFGSEHPYGYNSVANDYEALHTDDLRAYHKRWYQPENGLVVASGRIDQPMIDLINRTLGQHQVGDKTDLGSTFGERPTKEPVAPRKLHIHHPGALQNAIKIGRRLFNRKHPDFPGLFVLNTLLGGYFGSRLMMSIREKKGYTYNIYSSVDAMLRDGYLYIATEVAPENTATTIKAIRAEMKKLRDQPVPPEELLMVRNYLLGMLLNGLDGSMNISDVVRGMIVEEMSWESYDTLVQTIRNITPEEVQRLANQYLRPEDYWTVTVGV
jgi:zinc protease